MYQHLSVNSNEFFCFPKCVKRRKKSNYETNKCGFKLENITKENSHSVIINLIISYGTTLSGPMILTSIQSHPSPTIQTKILILLIICSFILAKFLSKPYTKLERERDFMKSISKWSKRTNQSVIHM